LTIPLYIGVEVVLGTAIFNKASGAFGILSIFTGHPINFWQWLYNMFALVVLPFYILGLLNLNSREKGTRKTSLVCILYVVDTIVGYLYTLYFNYFWFSHEDNSPTTDPYAGATKPDVDPATAAQSASAERELFLTMAITLLVAIFRLYTTLVVVSFTRALLKLEAAAQRYSNEPEVVPTMEPGWRGRVAHFVYDMEIRSREWLRSAFV
jgi:hypothetical protein